MNDIFYLCPTELELGHIQNALKNIKDIHMEIFMQIQCR